MYVNLSKFWCWRFTCNSSSFGCTFRVAQNVGYICHTRRPHPHPNTVNINQANWHAAITRDHLSPLYINNLLVALTGSQIGRTVSRQSISTTLRRPSAWSRIILTVSGLCRGRDHTPTTFTTRLTRTSRSHSSCLKWLFNGNLVTTSSTSWSRACF